MLVIIPGSWKCDLPDSVEVFRRHLDTRENHDRIRSALRNGESLFLLGTEGVARVNTYVVATDHIALFGGSSLVGPNNDGFGPRFPSLMGMYIAPHGRWDRGTVGEVPDWKLTTPAEMKLLGTEALLSEGVDEAEIAGHGGAKVVLLVKCHGWESTNMEVPPLREVAAAAEDLHKLKFTEGGEEQ